MRDQRIVTRTRPVISGGIGWPMSVSTVGATSARRETSVEEAALTAGYQNTSAFISAFRQVFGMTPGEYRRTLQGS